MWAFLLDNHTIIMYDIRIEPPSPNANPIRLAIDPMHACGEATYYN
jgi:hypothetical protein